MSFLAAGVGLRRESGGMVNDWKVFSSTFYAFENTFDRGSTSAVDVPNPGNVSVIWETDPGVRHRRRW